MTDHRSHSSKTHRTQTPFTTFSSLHDHLLKTYPAPVLPPVTGPSSKQLTPHIAALQLHPTLEAALHILNNDLSSAHFLVRHMQADPAWEGMFLHGILHRVEGDYENARCWYRDVVASEVYRAVWSCGRKTGGIDDGDAGRVTSGTTEGKGKGARNPDERDPGVRLIDLVERLKIEGRGERTELEKESRREIEGVINFCRKRFGEGRWEDASSAWVRPGEEVRKMGEDQVHGAAGRRTF